MHDFPAGRFAVWATAWLTGRTSYDEALDALLGVDSAHRVTGLPTPEAAPLGWALTALRGLGERRFRLVLPVPGDVRGIPAARAGQAALEAGQVAVGDRLALVPEAAGAERVDGVRSGRRPPPPPPVEGLCGRCRASSTSPSPVPPHAGRSRPGALAPRGAGPAGGAGQARRRPRLPPDHEPLAVSVLGRAQRLAKVLDLAMADAPGGAVTHSQAAARGVALRPLADAVREATVAAYNAVPRALGSLACGAMTAPMTMNRLIHAAVRRDLERLQAPWARPDGDRDRAPTSSGRTPTCTPS